MSEETTVVSTTEHVELPPSVMDLVYSGVTPSDADLSLGDGEETETETEDASDSDVDTEEEVSPTLESEDDELETIRDKAKRMEAFEDAYGKNPKDLVKHLMGNLSAEDRKELLESVKQTEVEDEMVPQTEVEEYVVKHKKAIESLPQFQEEVVKTFELRDRLAHEQYIDISIQAEQILGLYQHLGIEIPDAPRERIVKRLSDGKTSYRVGTSEEYRKLVAKAISSKKQATKERPTTPGSTSATGIQKPGKDATIAERMRWAELVNK